MDHNNRTIEMLAPKTLTNFDAMGDQPKNLSEEEAAEFLNERIYLHSTLLQDNTINNLNDFEKISWQAM